MSSGGLRRQDARRFSVPSVSADASQSSSSAVSNQPSAISHQPSVFSHQSPVASLLSASRTANRATTRIPNPRPQAPTRDPESASEGGGSRVRVLRGPVTQSAILPSASSDRRGVMGLLILLFAITYLDRVCISVAGPRMQEDLGIDPIGWGWVTGMFTLAYCLFEIPTGMLADRIGPRRVLTRIVVWWSAFTALTGAMTGFYPLLLTRFLFGAGEAGAFPNASVVVSRWFPPRQRATISGVNLMASQVGGAIAPLLVLPIQMRYGWRMSFFVFGDRRPGMGSGRGTRGSAIRRNRSGAASPQHPVPRPHRLSPRAMRSRGASPPGPLPCGRCWDWRSAMSTSTTSSRRGSTRSSSGAADSAKPPCSCRRCPTSSPRAPTWPGAPRVTRSSGGWAHGAAGASSVPRL